MSPKKKVKLNDSPEMSLIWAYDEVELLLEGFRNLKLRKHAEVRPCLTQQLLCFFLKHVPLCLLQMQNYFFVLPKLGTSLAYIHCQHPHT